VKPLVCQYQQGIQQMLPDWQRFFLETDYYWATLDLLYAFEAFVEVVLGV